MALMVANVRIVPDRDPTSAVAKRLGIPQTSIHDLELVKRSLDARRGKQLWSGLFRVEVHDETGVLARVKGVRRWNDRDDARYGRVIGAPIAQRWPADLRPIVIGAGPAGLFAALWLAESGVPVRLFERGGPVQERVTAVNGFWRGRLPLDPENNLLFGEGGAGTFSDGKIYTRRRDGELGFIFRRLVDFGADPEVLTDAYAHLGTDRIRAILPPFRERLRELGASLHFHTAMTGLLIEEGRCVGVRVRTREGQEREVRGGPVLVGTGHSARDTVQMLLDAGAAATPSPIAIGARIEHPQTLIDVGRYHHARGELPPASYRLTHLPEAGRRAHTFCMCPGGMVVPASNHLERAVVNGMSFAARRARFANSAIIVEVHPEDYGASDPMAGFRWQDTIEARCYAAVGDDRAPAQRVVDLLAGQASESLPASSYPMGLVPVDLRRLLPGFVVQGMIDAILAFDKQIPGFAGSDAVLIAPETRTTSPIRYQRDAQQCSTVPDLFPIGEGAGYGGGIVSSALDGLRAARGIATQKKPAPEVGAG